MIASIDTAQETTTPDPLLEKVSASRLNTFHQCRLKFYFRYVLKLTKTKTAALHVGSTVHAVLQFWNKARWRKEVITEEKIRETFAKAWVEEQAENAVRWGESESEEMESAWNLVQLYLNNSPLPVDEMPEGVEVEVEAQLKGFPRLIGILDLVRANGLIVDFKTVGQTPNPEKSLHLHETQLACYGVLYREATGKKESGFELHSLVKLKSPKMVVSASGPMTSKQEVRLFKTIESYIKGVEAEDWVPSPSPMSCACCEYFNECRAWG